MTVFRGTCAGYGFLYFLYLPAWLRAYTKPRSDSSFFSIGKDVRRLEITLKSREEIGYMQEAGRILSSCHRGVADKITPGITTMQINDWVGQAGSRS